MGYEKTHLEKTIEIDYLVTVHYFEYGKNFNFAAEKHDFWELVYVDKGEATVLSDDVRYALRQGEIFFHRPNSMHAAVANGMVAPNMVVLSFGCHSPSMEWFSGKRLTVGDSEKRLLSMIVKEAKGAFSSPLNDPYSNGLERAENPSTGSEQMVGLLLETLLIRLLRRGNGVQENQKAMSSLKVRTNNQLVHRVIEYMKANVPENLTFDDVCHFSAQSATNLKTTFKLVTGYGVMEYYRLLKVETAKQMMREGNYNITEIADYLGYASVHYFSRHFKQVTGMTPSEYTMSIQAF